MFTYQYQRYGESSTEDYADLVELLERTWSDIEYMRAMPMGVTYRGEQLFDRKNLLELAWFNVMRTDIDRRQYFETCASITKLLLNTIGA